MNPFVASIILSQVPLEDFLDKLPEVRVQEYGGLVGWKRVVRPVRHAGSQLLRYLQDRFNGEIARRLVSIQLPPSSPQDTSESACV